MSELRLYDYAASANCFKVRLLLEQLGRPYERIAVDIFGGDTLTADFGRKNPLRATPVLQVGPARWLIESNAILFYLAEGTSFLPATSLGRADVLRWLVYEQTDIVPAIAGLRFRLQTGRLAPNEPDAVRRRGLGLEVLGILDTHLSRRPFLVARSYSIADIAVHAYVHVAGQAGYDMTRWPAVGRWLDRVAGQPGYVNDLEPYPANAHAGAGHSMYE